MSEEQPGSGGAWLQRLGRLLRPGPAGDPLPEDWAELTARVERVLLGGRRRYDRRQVAQAAGVSLEHAQRLWRAMGFAEAPDGEVLFTDGDLEALRMGRTLVAQGAIGEDAELAVIRSLGQALSRLAEWQVDLLYRMIVERAGELTAAEALAGVEALLPVMERLQAYVWRRHLAAASGRALAASPEELTARQLVVGFADLVGFTRLTRGLTETDLDTLLERFEGTATEIVVGHRGRVVKTLGDEVLFTADEVSDGAEIGLALVERLHGDEEMPQLRVGLALGVALTRFGDVYGSVVNIASRLTTLARPGTVLVDRELATALAGEPGYRVRARRPVAVRGYRSLHPWSLRRE